MGIRLLRFITTGSTGGSTTKVLAGRRHGTETVGTSTVHRLRPRLIPGVVQRSLFPASAHELQKLKPPQLEHKRALSNGPDRRRQFRCDLQERTRPTSRRRSFEAFVAAHASAGSTLWRTNSSPILCNSSNTSASTRSSSPSTFASCRALSTNPLLRWQVGDRFREQSAAATIPRCYILPLRTVEGG